MVAAIPSSSSLSSQLILMVITILTWNLSCCYCDKELLLPPLLPPPRSILTILVSIYHGRSIAVQAPASRALRPLPHIVTQVRVYILTSELTCSCLATRPPALPPPSLSSRPLTENEGNEDAEAFAAEETNTPCRVPEETSMACASGGSAVRARARDRE